MIYIEENLELVKRISLIVILVMVLGVRPFCTAAAVCISSVLPKRGTLQYVGINMVADDDSLMKAKLQHSCTKMMGKDPKFVWSKVNGRKMKDVGNIELNIPEP